ncbi:MAG: toxin-antitoxin system, antitoxin component, Xre family protein [Deltaproteobacteria bacterium]|nr:toxin-antitoxin system, antitoxin component, Xre family protein [Deltaproteobacteria bacterium]
MNTGQNAQDVNRREAALIDKIRALPPEKVNEVEDFVDFLQLRAEERQLIREAAGLSEKAFHDVWDNTEDAAYDRL